MTEKTKLYAVIGHPVAHSLSPAMHNANFAANGDTNCSYDKEDKTPEELTDFILKNPKGYSGLSVTIPHKEAVFEIFVKHGFPRDPHATTAKSVNTIKFAKDGPKGFSTDGIGFVKAFEEAFGTSLEGMNVFIFGRGGSARAVETALQKCGAFPIVSGREDFKDVQLLQKMVINKDVAINATPIGMSLDDPAFFLPQMFGKVKFAFDLIYTREETPFMRAALDGGAKAAANGLKMLLYQGAAQYKIWTGKDANIEAMDKALRENIGTKT